MADDLLLAVFRANERSDGEEDEKDAPEEGRTSDDVMNSMRRNRPRAGATAGEILSAVSARRRLAVVDVSPASSAEGENNDGETGVTKGSGLAELTLGWPLSRAVPRGVVSLSLCFVDVLEDELCALLEAARLTLRELRLDGLPLLHLPLFIPFLPELSVLSLQNTLLCELPGQWLGAHSSLRVLDVRGSLLLRYLPLEVRQLRQLRDIFHTIPAFWWNNINGMHLPDLPQRTPVRVPRLSWLCAALLSEHGAAPLSDVARSLLPDEARLQVQEFQRCRICKQPFRSGSGVLVWSSIRVGEQRHYVQVPLLGTLCSETCGKQVQRPEPLTAFMWDLNTYPIGMVDWLSGATELVLDSDVRRSFQDVMDDGD
jgi:hypothetical protein